MQDQPTSSATSRRVGLIVPLLLIGIVLLGGYLRFNGLNWDDFSALHPDERFLTLNLLPLVGGNLDMTDDPRYPAQTILVSSSSPYTNRFELEANPATSIGAIEGTLGSETADGLFTEIRVRRYSTPEQALSALLNSEVLALVVAETEVPIYGISVRPLQTLSSADIQLTRCQTRYPETSGVGGYFDTDCSSLNPHNAGAGFYAYGTLPLFIAHFGSDLVRDGQQQQKAFRAIMAASSDPSSPNATVVPQDWPLEWHFLSFLEKIHVSFDFQGGPLVWRFFSAFFDVATIFLVFLIGTRLYHYRLGLLAALIYAAMPLAIEKAHYGTVNAITTFFVALGLWAAVRVQDKGRLVDFFIFGIALGAAVSGRINTAPLAVLVVLAAMVYSARA